MGEGLERFVADLQERIYEETRMAYGDKAFQRWLHPLYEGALAKPDGYARLAGRCGDSMEIFLRFRDGRVQEATYRTDGCGASSVCGSLAAEMSLGKTVDDLLDITGENILMQVGGLQEEERHCAFLAAETLQEALHHYMANQVKRRKEV